MNKNQPQWEIRAVKDLQPDQFVSRFGAAFNRVTLDAFAERVSFSTEQLTAHLNSSTHIGVLRDYEGNVNAFTLLTIFETLPLQGKLLAWIDKIAVVSAEQGKGIGVQGLLTELQSFIGRNNLGWIGCCTQSNTLIYAFNKLGQHAFPLQSAYGSLNGIGPWTYLALHVPQIRNRLFSKNGSELDDQLLSNYGIIKGGYSLNINVSNVRLPENLQRTLRFRNFVPDNGDMLILLTQLN